MSIQFQINGVSFVCDAVGGLRLGFVRVAVFAVAFSLASAMRYLASSVAPVRGGTYFSLPPQRKVGKRKRLTPLILVFA
ncbi:hypothetical protein Q8F57_027545 [Paraburkholderia terrae]|uniref:hypothetical protein n=1 Tax=Paraburkholderia terrae TaxID=311230 RepID=UPI00296AC04B|nr:hypothetical protein [Paraburkholderia terrae]MDW3661280.1 hypothetical protein [Paraburkholderia terrae]